MLLAAAVALVVLPRDGVVLKSGALDFEVYVHDGVQSRLVQSGARVRPGDRVSFRVLARSAGWLLVVGADEVGHTYLCWPQGPEDEPPRALEGPVAAVAFGPTAGPEVLAAAMRFDEVLGREHLVAVFCPEPFGFSDVATSGLVRQDGELLADFRRLHPGCTIRRVVLEKVAR